MLAVLSVICWAILGLGALVADSAWAQSGAIDSLEEDGLWCPMAHCNRRDDSFQDLPPLRSLESAQMIFDPNVAQSAFINLGCASGEAMAVCAYGEPGRPALVAYDYQDGSVRWLSPMEDLPGGNGRRASGVPLLVKIGVNGAPPQGYVFASNHIEFVAYTADGVRLWKRASTDVTPLAPQGIGHPISLSFSEAGELVAATNLGWIVKLDPLDGSTVDAYQMRTNVFLGNSLFQGVLVNENSPAVIGNVMYLVVRFKADPSKPLPSFLSPVYVVRIELNQPGTPGQENKIKPLSLPVAAGDPTPDRVFIGLNNAGGSPPAWVKPDGKVLIFADADAFVNGAWVPLISAVEDDQGVLTQRWWSRLTAIPGDDILGAPGLHAASRTLVVTTWSRLYVFKDVDQLVGQVSPPAPLPFDQLQNCGTIPPNTEVSLGGPMGLAFDSNTNEVVTYTNLRVRFSFFPLTLNFLVAFGLPVEGPMVGSPLWCSFLGYAFIKGHGLGAGTAGQPVLFRYDKNGSEATGLIVTTFGAGTYIFR
jgi:hypothetical protein